MERRLCMELILPTKKILDDCSSVEEDLVTAGLSTKHICEYTAVLYASRSLDWNERVYGESGLDSVLQLYDHICHDILPGEYRGRMMWHYAGSETVEKVKSIIYRIVYSMRDIMATTFEHLDLDDWQRVTVVAQRWINGGLILEINQ